MYLLFGGLALLASAVVLISPSVIVPGQSGLVTHLFQEQAAAFVFVGLMFLWCARHPAERRPVHGALALFMAIYAGLHWWGVLQDGERWIGAAATTVPVALLALTFPRASGRPLVACPPGVPRASGA